MKDLQWPTVLWLSTGGLLFAGLTILGWIHGLEVIVVLGMLVLCAVVLVRKADGALFRHGLVTGFLFGLWAVWTQALFLPVYFDNNPGYAEIPIPFGMDPRLATAVLGPINAVVGGLVTGLLCLALGRLIQRPSKG